VGLDYSIWPGLGSLVGWDHRVIFSIVYLLMRCLLGCLMVLPGFGRAGAGDLGVVV
jgi:hypothetical protein